MQCLRHTRLIAEPGRALRQPGRLLVEEARAQIDDDGHTERCQRAHGRLFVEPDDAVVLGVHFENDRIVGERSPVVVEAGAIRGTDLD